jgi:two-component system LytT family response regulator
MASVVTTGNDAARKNIVRSVNARTKPRDTTRQLRQGPGNRLLIKSGGKFRFIRLQDLDWCEASGNYVRLHAGAHVHVVRATLQQLESCLDAAHFVRVHRSTIVHVDHIHEVHPSFNGEYTIVLKDQTQLTLSRGYREMLLGVIE